MASEYGTYRVFVSSSMAELAKERAVINEIIEEAGYQPFLYERDADARPWNHEETFVQELKASHLYVGVFWKKYGPYTVEEFELATERGIPRLVFEKATPAAERDLDLRKFLEKHDKVNNPDGVTIARFETPEDLREKFQRSFKNFLAEGAKRGWGGRGAVRESSDTIPPKDLPCLCDRDPQEIQFEAQVTAYFQVHSKRPLLVILPGSVKERHGLYLNRVKLCSLEEYLNKAGIRGGKKLVQVRKSPCAMSASAHLRSEILGLLQEPDSGNDHSIVEHIRKKKLKALLIVVRVLASECEENPQQPLQLIIDYLSAFPDTPEQVLVSVVACLEEDGALPKFRGWWRRALGSIESTKDPFTPTMAAIQDQYRDGKTLRVEILPRLASPKTGDVRRWVEHELVKSSVPYVAEKTIEDLFEGRDSLPMDELYPKLHDLLESGKAGMARQ